MNYNKVFFAGRLTADPELKSTPNGKYVTTFTIAVNRYKDETADFFDVVAWNKTAEFVCNHFAKGVPIFIEGSLQTRTYTNSKGVNVKVYEIVADKVEFTESKRPTEQTSIDVEPDAPESIFPPSSDPDEDRLPF